VSENSTPNILFFFTDDQRFSTINALGYDFIHTPNLDKLVKRGTTFTHAHIPGGTVGAVCMPSRAMLHTGRTLFRLAEAGKYIPKDHVMMGEWLQAHGYRTFGTGKWHNGSDSYARSFTDGAEIFFGGMNDHWNVPACDFSPTGEYPEPTPVVRNPYGSNQVSYQQADHTHYGKHSTELFAEAAIDFLQAYDGDDPFFMYVSFMAPHDPRTMPKKYLDMYDPDEIELPPNFCPIHPFNNGALRIRDEMLAGFPREPEEIRRHIAEYYAMISHLDAEIGKVLTVLEETGQAEDTIILLAGDNGLAVGQHGLMGKQNNYDHSVRVPLIMAGPGIPEDIRTDAFVYLLDIFATLGELLELPVPETVEGKSLVPAMEDPGTEIRETLYFVYSDKMRAVRNKRYKLIEYVVGDERHTQLFDLQKDPWETNDLSNQPEHLTTIEELRQHMFLYRDRWCDTRTEWGQTFWRGYQET
jgi:arylsulfatase A-like enzyme